VPGGGGGDGHAQPGLRAWGFRARGDPFRRAGLGTRRSHSGRPSARRGSRRADCFLGEGAARARLEARVERPRPDRGDGLDVARTISRGLSVMIDLEGEGQGKRGSDGPERDERLVSVCEVPDEATATMLRDFLKTQGIEATAISAQIPWFGTIETARKGFWG